MFWEVAPWDNPILCKNMGFHVKYEDLTNLEVKLSDFPSFPALWGGNRALAGRGRKHQRNQWFSLVFLGASGSQSPFFGGFPPN